MTVDPNLLAVCRIGTIYRTRDRRDARIERICPEEGLIYGQVQMHGACAWRTDGRYRDAPFGAAGPLDLVAPVETASATAGPRRASVKEALEEQSRHFCCD